MELKIEQLLTSKMSILSTSWTGKNEELNNKVFLEWFYFTIIENEIKSFSSFINVLITVYCLP